ncbi:hypothetical protein LZ32DRAFT_111404 [Colletotrichum eremochloae]|nr:hypothetical protein LZ32DRAFT_111404 [Colletotrichum eremochloae]
MAGADVNMALGGRDRAPCQVPGGGNHHRVADDGAAMEELRTEGRTRNFRTQS